MSTLDTILGTAFAAADRVRHNALVKAADVRPTGITASSPSVVSRNMSRGAEVQYQHFNGWQYVAIRAIAQRIAGQSVCVGRLTKKQTIRKAMAAKMPRMFKSMADRVVPLDSHPLRDAIADPNPLMVRWSLLYVTVAGLELTGKAFWWMVDTPDGLQIWPVPAHWVEPMDNMRTAWLIRPPHSPEPIPVPGDAMAFFYLPDPSDPFGAVSPLSTQANAVDADEAIQEAQRRAFQNGVFPKMVITAGRLPGMNGGEGQRPILEEGQRKQIIAAIKTLYQGVAKYDEPIILDGLIESVNKISNTPAEMDFLASGKQTKSRIMQAFGVNPMVTGEIEGANRAQAVVAEENFCSNAINPLLEMMSQVMTAWVGSAYASDREKLVVWIECCKPHDAEQSLKEWEVGLKLGAATPNEYRVTVLNLPAIAGLDDPYVPVGMMARDDGDETTEPSTGDPYGLTDGS
ncbi:MAG: phage portal protein [Planctomycetaceae bacterium]|nr:phage portal protein [Planctomycetaceae bacterium]